MLLETIKAACLWDTYLGKGGRMENIYASFTNVIYTFGDNRKESTVSNPVAYIIKLFGSENERR